MDYLSPFYNEATYVLGVERLSVLLGDGGGCDLGHGSFLKMARTGDASAVMSFRGRAISS